MLWAALCITANSGCPCPLCAKSRHSALRQRLALFDYLGGGDKQALRHGEAESLCRLEIDNGFVLSRRLYRQIRRLLALENARHSEVRSLLGTRAWLGKAEFVGTECGAPPANKPEYRKLNLSSASAPHQRLRRILVSN